MNPTNNCFHKNNCLHTSNPGVLGKGKNNNYQDTHPSLKIGIGKVNNATETFAAKSTFLQSESTPKEYGEGIPKAIPLPTVSCNVQPAIQTKATGALHLPRFNALSEPSGRDRSGLGSRNSEGLSFQEREKELDKEHERRLRQIEDNEQTLRESQKVRDVRNIPKSWEKR